MARKPARAHRRISLRGVATSALATLLLAGASVVVPQYLSGQLPKAAADPVVGTDLLEDDFMGPSASASAYVTGGISFTPCLTAGTAQTTGPIGKCSGTSDAAGTGALRLTDAQTNRSGYLLYNKALPTKAGLDISFNFYQYGGTGADGIAFFLTDGSKTLTTAGPVGGSLGYHHNGKTGSEGANSLGLANSLLGVGFDAYGNFPVEWNDSSCPIPGGSRVTDIVAVRGPGGADRQSGYCLLAAPTSYAAGIDNIADGANRSTSQRQARIVIDPPSGTDPKVSVYIGGSLITTVPQPAELKTTPTFKFGWAASTGGSTNAHEINFLQVKSVEPIRPELTVTGPATTPTNNATKTTTVNYTVSTKAEGGPEAGPVTATITIPADVDFAGTPSGTGWACDEPTATTATCTYTPATRIDPGTDLPALSVPVTSQTPGDHSISVAASSPTNVGSASSTVGDLHIDPFVDDFSATYDAVVAGTVRTGQLPAAVGATDGYSRVTDTSIGSALVGPDGELAYTQPAGASGRTTFTYRVDDPSSGLSSNIATGTITIRPTAIGSNVSTTVGQAVSTDLADPIGTGPFTWAITTAPAQGTASVTSGANGQFTYTPPAGYSGPASFTVTATDAGGITSLPVTVNVTVAPTTGALSATGTLDAVGEVNVTTGAPSPTGSGPFTYSLVTPPSFGTATISPTTGAITYVLGGGRSGIFGATYRVADANDPSVASATATATFNIHPYAPALTGSTRVGEAVTLDLPAVNGTGPFSYRLISAPSDASIAADGAITLAARAQSGTATFSYEVTDADGLASTNTVTITVKPTTDALQATVDASDTPAAVELDATPAGSGPFTYQIATSFDPSLGDAVVTSTGVEITPAAGFSGRLSVGYTVTDTHGVESDGNTATVTVRPVGHDASVSLVSGDTATVNPKAPIGTGPMTATVTSNVAGKATVVPRGGTGFTITGVDGYSGTFIFTYRLTDAAGVESEPATITVNIAPIAKPTTLPIASAPKSGAPAAVTAKLPTPVGDGPFTYQLVAAPDPSKGTATIDPVTGEVTFTPAPGVSGIIEFTYKVIDADGNESTRAVVRASVRPATTSSAPAGSDTAGSDASQPVAAPSAATTTLREPVRFSLPEPVGKGPFTFRILNSPPASQGTITLDPDTGEVVFIAAEGFTGIASFSYEIVDADGIVSEPNEITVEVLGRQEQRATPALLAFTGNNAGLLAPAIGLVGLGMLMLVLRRRRLAGGTA